MLLILKYVIYQDNFVKRKFRADLKFSLVCTADLSVSKSSLNKKYITEQITEYNCYQ